MGYFRRLLRTKRDDVVISLVLAAAGGVMGVIAGLTWESAFAVILSSTALAVAVVGLVLAAARAAPPDAPYREPDPSPGMPMDTLAESMKRMKERIRAESLERAKGRAFAEGMESAKQVPDVHRLRPSPAGELSPQRRPNAPRLRVAIPGRISNEASVAVYNDGDTDMFTANIEYRDVLAEWVPYKGLWEEGETAEIEIREGDFKRLLLAVATYRDDWPDWPLDSPNRDGFRFALLTSTAHREHVFQKWWWPKGRAPEMSVDVRVTILPASAPEKRNVTALNLEPSQFGSVIVRRAGDPAIPSYAVHAEAVAELRKPGNQSILREATGLRRDIGAWCVERKVAHGLEGSGAFDAATTSAFYEEFRDRLVALAGRAKDSNWRVENYVAALATQEPAKLSSMLDEIIRVLDETARE